MAKNIKVGIKLPSNNQLKTEMQSAIKLMEKYATLDFKIDTKEFTKSLTSMSNELSKLKTQLSKFNILESIQVDSSQVSKAKQEVKELGDELSKAKNKNLASESITKTKDGVIEIKKYKDSIAEATTEVIKNGEVTKQTFTKNAEQIEKMKNQLQINLNKVIGSQFVDGNFVDVLKEEINSLSTNTSVESFNKLKAAIDDVVKSNDTLKSQAEQRIKIEQSYNNLWEKLLKERESKEEQSNQKLLEQMANFREKSEARVANENSKLELKQAQEINKALEEQYALEQKLAEQMADFREKSQIRTSNENAELELKQAQAINKALEEQYENQQKLANLKEQLQSKLNVAKDNDLIDVSVISKLQKQLDSINTNTSEKEINELKSAISNLSSTDSDIVRIQNAINKLQDKIISIKKNNIDIIDDSEIRELKLAQTELTKLKSIKDSLKAGEVIDGSAISNQINIATNSVRNLETKFKDVDKASSGLSDTMKNIFGYALGGSAFYSAMNAMKNAVDTTIELDTAMRDLKRVTDESQSTYSNFTKTANKTAIELGATTAGAIEATTTFSQLGYSFEESSEYLSKMALMLSNVGDISASDAASSIVSILKGFRLESEETTRILDVLNEAGNRFALTTADLTEGLRIGGASLAVANNDLEEASALIISGTEILRDSNMVANGLKTISMRMRGVSEDGEELNASMGEFIKNMTDVDLTDANGEFRSTYEVLKDIGKVWDKLNSMQQASLAEQIAGKNRANVFTSL